MTVCKIVFLTPLSYFCPSFIFWHGLWQCVKGFFLSSESKEIDQSAIKENKWIVRFCVQYCSKMAFKVKCWEPSDHCVPLPMYKPALCVMPLVKCPAFLTVCKGWRKSVLENKCANDIFCKKSKTRLRPTDIGLFLLLFAGDCLRATKE